MMTRIDGSFDEEVYILLALESNFELSQAHGIVTKDAISLGLRCWRRLPDLAVSYPYSFGRYQTQGITSDTCTESSCLGTWNA